MRTLDAGSFLLQMEESRHRPRMAIKSELTPVIPVTHHKSINVQLPRNFDTMIQILGEQVNFSRSYEASANLNNRFTSARDPLNGRDGMSRLVFGHDGKFINRHNYLRR